MAMLLDYGQKTVTVAPFKVAPKGTAIVTSTVKTGTTTKATATNLLNVKTQIATGSTTKALQTALKPTATVVKVPYVMEAFPEAQLPVMPWDTKPSTSTVVKSVTPQYSPGVKEAVLEAANRKMGLSITSTSKAQQIIALARSAAIVKNISAQGYELAPKGTKDYLGIAQSQASQFAEEINAFRGLQEEWSFKQSGYLQTLSENEKLLAKASSEGAIAKGQLASLTAEYGSLMQQYQELLKNPPEKPGTDIFGGLGDFIAKYGLWIALGVGAIILLPSIMRIFERR